MGVNRNHSVCPSVRPSVHLSICVLICVQSITFLWFDIGLPYLAHGCMTMRGCVRYIHDPDTTLNFDLKVNFIGVLTFRVWPITFFLVWHWLTIFGAWVSQFIGFLTCFSVWPITIFWFDTGLPYLVHWVITMRRCDTFMFPIRCWPLTSRSNL